ncbi:MAG: hypothetical protein FWC34_10965 [Bacteroidetes bacterium]|nr:hypothetical protein [Bacteroidota bacterium]MCL2302938.1 hypothetical protein [Lentimicrobiaceae bacterium]
MKQISIDGLNLQLFEAIEMLKNNTDPKASENEKISVEAAEAIAELGKVIVSGIRIQADVLKYVSSAQNPDLVKQILANNDTLQLMPKKGD